MNSIISIKNKDQANSFINELFDTDINKQDFAVTSYTKSPSVWIYKILEILDFKCYIVVENFHVDRVFRDSYYMYFSNQHFDTFRFCKRLSFFKNRITDEMFYDVQKHKRIQKSFLGSCVIKPIASGAIGRTLLDAKIFSCHNKIEAYERLTEFKISVRGLPLTVESFPFSMQDTETLSCAEVTLVNLMEYFSNRYPDYKFIYPSDIMEITKKSSCERVLPTKGMTYTQLTKILTEFGFSPRLYNEEAFAFKKFAIKKIWHYYIESGIPVALGLKDPEQKIRIGHSIIGIGHTKKRRDFKQATLTHRDGLNIIDTADLYDQYVIMDDTLLPFAIRDFQNITEHDLQPNILSVPLAKRMFMEATDAFDISVTIITNEALGIKRISNQFEDYKNLGSVEHPFVLRLFLTSARSYKLHKISCNDDNLYIRKVFSRVPLPRFVWVCEIYTTDSFEKHQSIGEIVLDATSSGRAQMESLVALRYLNRIAIRTPNKNLNDLVDFFRKKDIQLDTNFLMTGFSGNLKVTDSKTTDGTKKSRKQ